MRTSYEYLRAPPSLVATEPAIEGCQRRAGVGDVGANEHRLVAESREVALAGDNVVGTAEFDVDLHGDVGHVLLLATIVEGLANVNALRGDGSGEIECGRPS